MTNSMINNNASVNFSNLGNSSDKKSLNANNSNRGCSTTQNENDKEGSLLYKRNPSADIWSNFLTASDKISNIQTKSEMLRFAPTTEDNLVTSVSTEEKLSGVYELTHHKQNDCPLPDFSFEKNIDCDVSVYTNESKSFHLGRFQFQYTKPGFDGSSEKMKAGGGAGLSTGINIAHANPDLKIGELGRIDARFRVGVANVDANIEGKLQIDSLNPKMSGASIKGGLGAEALLGDARYAMAFKITPKTIGDTLAGIYNNYVDPVVDSIAGYDVPEMPCVPEEYDHGVSVSGHVTTGFGGAAKIGGELEIGDGKGFKLGAKAKLGVGPVLGAGLTVGVK
ncbi:hypothetical protein A3197_12275 [Candidatus Thiodiazotropha endoloripes]|nr:hypothetical protein A3197_12275 [Candidatus Thiodiazotropha endoloripes]